MGVLKKAANGVLAACPCSLLLRTLRPSQQLWPSLRHDSGQDWTSFFEQSSFFRMISVIHMGINRQNISILQQHLYARVSSKQPPSPVAFHYRAFFPFALKGVIVY